MNITKYWPIILLVILSGIMLGVLGNKSKSSISISDKNADIRELGIVKQDLEVLFENKLEIDVQTFPIYESIRLLPNKRKPYLEKTSPENLLLQVALTDKSYRKIKNGIDEEATRVNTEAAIEILYYLTERRYNPSIEAVIVGYEPKTSLQMRTINWALIITIPEFLTEKQLLLQQGYPEEQIKEMLMNKFINRASRP